MKQHLLLATLILLTATALFAQSAKKETPNFTSLSEFVTKLNQETKPQIIDARSAEEFALNHLNGALNFNTQSPNYADLVKTLDSQKPVFTYSIGNGRSTVLANDLRAKGFPQVYELAGGIGAWSGGGQPLVTTYKNTLSLNDFNNILATNKTVLVDVGSRFCGACKKVKPILETLRKEQGDAVKVVEIDLEQSPELIGALKIVTVFSLYFIVQRW